MELPTLKKWNSRFASRTAYETYNEHNCADFVDYAAKILKQI